MSWEDRAEEEGYFPCVCCGIGNQELNGFCSQCNRAGCEEEIKKWGIK